MDDTDVARLKAELTDLLPMAEQAEISSAAVAASAAAVTASLRRALGLAAPVSAAAEPRVHGPLDGVDWLCAIDWPPRPEMIDLRDPVWMRPKAAAHDLDLDPNGGAIYERIKRRPIAVQIGRAWYVNMVRALTPTGSLPGETK